MKANEFPREVLLEELVKKVKAEIVSRFPRLANEPFSEYNEHIREEVEYAAVALIGQECDRKFGKRKKQWKDL